MTFVSELEPRELWSHFDQILTIPRGSKNEQAMREYVISVARRKQLTCDQDDTGNIVVRKPGNGDAGATVLQSHLDMVNEKNADVTHDFSRDAIQPRRDGEYLKASGTTLGSDNGIGVAAALAVLESDSIDHGPLECLFTVDEETGLTGASGLSPDLLKGVRLINLDTEEEHTFCVGCAGGAGVNLNLELASTAAPEKASSLKVKLHRLRGGHSGVDIHLQRGNAIKLLARALHGVMRDLEFDLADFSGGNAHNAIPREAFALVVPEGEPKAFTSALEKKISAIRNEFKAVEPDMELSVSEGGTPETILERDSGRRLLLLLRSLPHGVLSMSNDIPDLVETSSNLATAAVRNGALQIHVSNRSSVDSALTGIQERVSAIAMLAGAQVEWAEGYPGWQPDMDSALLKLCREVHREIFGAEPEVEVVHAGLECGIIKEKYPRMDMISLGPQIEFPHSPDERVKIATVADFYRLLAAILGQLAARG